MGAVLWGVWVGCVFVGERVVCRMHRVDRAAGSSFETNHGSCVHMRVCACVCVRERDREAEVRRDSFEISHRSCVNVCVCFKGGERESVWERG